MTALDLGRVINSEFSIRVRRLATLLARTSRAEERYQVDPQIPAGVLLGVMTQKFVDALRGASLKIRSPDVALPCFVGRKVKVVGRKKLSIGRGCVLGDYVLIDAVSRLGVHLSDNVTLDRHVVIRCTGTLRQIGEGVRIGAGSSIGAFSYLGGSGGLDIGCNVLGGQRLGFHPENHVFQNPNRLIKEQGTTREGITVEDDCWLGSGAVFLDGVTIRKGSVVGAGSVVTHDVPAFSIVAGVPAKVIGQREEPQ